MRAGWMSWRERRPKLRSMLANCWGWLRNASESRSLLDINDFWGTAKQTKYKRLQLSLTIHI